LAPSTRYLFSLNTIDDVTGNAYTDRYALNTQLETEWDVCKQTYCVGKTGLEYQKCMRLCMKPVLELIQSQYSFTSTTVHTNVPVWTNESGELYLTLSDVKKNSVHLINITSAGDPGDPPAAPSNLSANAVSSSQIDLSWSDNSANETLFNIERSTDGSSFSFHDSVTVDVSSYSDTGLSANTPYWYQVSAENPDGESVFSNVASTSTDPAGDATALALRSITVSTVRVGKGQKRQRAVVVVEDDTGSLVLGALVTGTFSGTITENDLTGTTGSDGSTTIDTIGTAKGKMSFEFCVTSISGAGLESFERIYGEACDSL
jgi:hypothetical protein